MASNAAVDEINDLLTEMNVSDPEEAANLDADKLYLALQSPLVDGDEHHWSIILTTHIPDTSYVFTIINPAPIDRHSRHPNRKWALLELFDEINRRVTNRVLEHKETVVLFKVAIIRPELLMSIVVVVRNLAPIGRASRTTGREISCSREWVLEVLNELNKGQLVDMSGRATDQTEKCCVLMAHCMEEAATRDKDGNLVVRRWEMDRVSRDGEEIQHLAAEIARLGYDRG